MVKVVRDQRGEGAGYMCLMSGGLRSMGGSLGMKIIRPASITDGDMALTNY